MNNQQRKIHYKNGRKGIQRLNCIYQHFLRNFLKYKVIFSHTKYARIIVRHTQREMTKGDRPLIKLKMNQFATAHHWFMLRRLRWWYACSMLADIAMANEFLNFQFLCNDELKNWIFSKWCQRFDRLNQTAVSWSGFWLELHLSLTYVEHIL